MMNVKGDRERQPDAASSGASENAPSELYAPPDCLAIATVPQLCILPSSSLFDTAMQLW